MWCAVYRYAVGSGIHVYGLYKLTWLREEEPFSLVVGDVRQL